MRASIKGRKAIISEEVIGIVRWIYFGYVIVFIIAVMTLSSVKILDTGDAEAAVLANRLFFESSWHDSESGRVFVGALEPALTNDLLDKRIDFVVERRVGGKISSGSDSYLYNSLWYNGLRPRAGYDVKLAKGTYYGIHGSRVDIEVLV